MNSVGAARKPPSGLFEAERKKIARSIASAPVPTPFDDRLAIAARLELARALHHLSAARKRIAALPPIPTPDNPKKRDGIGAEGGSLSELMKFARGELAAASVMRRPSGPIIARYAERLMALEQRGLIDRDESNRAFDRLVSHSAFTHSEVKGMSSNQTDTPPELGSYADGPSDDGAYHPEIIGCGLDGLDIGGSLQHISVAGRLQHLSVAGGLGSLAVGGLGDLAVAGIPSYLLTRRQLSNPVVRRRVASAIERMTPKMKRRVLSRLRTAVSVARVSGEVRGAYPSIAGGCNVGWSGVMVSGRGGCPYASVAGALTP